MNDETQEFNKISNLDNFPYLLLLNSKSTEIKFLIKPGNNLIGRVSDSDIILDDVTVSRNHGSIEFIENVCCLIDFNSTNGIYLNDNLISTKVQLNSGDKLQIGKYLLLFSKN